MLPNGRQRIACAEIKFLGSGNDNWFQLNNPPYRILETPRPEISRSSCVKLIHGKCDQVETDPWQVAVAEHTHRHAQKYTQMWTPGPIWSEEPKIRTVRRQLVRIVRTSAVRRQLLSSGSINYFKKIAICPLFIIDSSRKRRYNIKESRGFLGDNTLL